MKVKLKIDELMKENNFTQKEFEELTGIPQSVISTMIRGKKDSIKFDHIEKIADILGIKDINQIITLVDEKETQK